MLIVSFSVFASNEAAQKNEEANRISGSANVTQPTLSIQNAEEVEGFGGIAFYVTLSQPAATNVTGKISTIDISATASVDYTALTNQPFTITTGSTETFFFVNLLDDNFRELTETFKISVTQISNAAVNAAEEGGWAYGNIIDDDTTPAVSISDNTVNEGAGTASLVLALSAPHTSDTSVTIQTFEDSANTTLDFVNTNKTITIPTGEISITVPITIVNDTLDEASEQFFVRIISSSVLIDDNNAQVTITDDDAPPNLAVQPVSASEADEVIIFRVTTDAVSGQDVTGLANTTDGSAKASFDYTKQVNKIFTIPSGITETTIYVPVNDDTLYESNETFTLTVKNVVNANITTASNVATIVNDDQGPAVAISDASDNESTQLEFLISLDNISAVNATGTITTTSNTAMAGSDFVAVTSLPFTITAGTLTTTVSIDPVNDLLYEETELFTVTVGSLAHATASDLVAVGSILDNDPLPSLSIDDVVIAESTPNMTFTISLDTPSSLDVIGFVNTFSNTTSAPEDYTELILRPFTITAGLTSTQVVVTIHEDLLDEYNEILTLYVINVDHAELLKDQGTGTITDNDEPPTLDIESTTFAESQSGVITATLSVPSGRPIAGTITTNNGTATATYDYGPLIGKPFTIPAGKLYTEIEFYIINDSIDEYDEDFHAKLMSVNNATAGITDIDITLVDDDAPPTINVMSTSASESEGIINIPVRLSRESGKTITGTLSSSDGAALSPQDFTTVSLVPFTIEVGQTEVLIPVTVADDTVDENDEEFGTTLNEAVNATLGVTFTNATIVDDDVAPAISIADISGGEESGAFTFTVSINAISSLTVTGKISTENNSAVGGSDFGALNNVTFVIPAGSTTTTVAVPIINDLSDEYNEKFYVNLSALSNAQIGDASATGTITDNDEPPTISITSTTAVEGAGALAFNISISVASGKDIKLQVNTFDGTATSPSDYVKQSDRSYTISAGKASDSIVVDVVKDQSDEPDENITIQIALIDPTTAHLANANSIGTILDDDLPPTLTVADVSSNENSGTLNFVLKLSAPSAFPINGTVATSNGTAIGGTDYTGMDAQSFSFPTGSDQVTIPVPLLNDLLLESNETFTFTVVNLVGATKQDAVALGTIQDDDSSGTGTLIIQVDVAPKSIQNFKFTPAFDNPFYLDDEVDGAQNDGYTHSKSYNLTAGTYLVTPTTPYSYFLMDIVCTSGNTTIKTGTTPQLPVLGSGQSVTCTFFNERGITVRAQSYNDLSRNRAYDQADALLAGVQTKLFVTSEPNPLLTETTDSTGQINWSYRRPGEYTVCAADWPLTVPLMVQPTLVDLTYSLPCYRFDLQPGAIADVYFGFRVDDGTVVAAIEGINAFDSSLTAGSLEEGVLFSQAPDVTNDMQGYEEQTSEEENDQSVKVYLPVVTR